MAWIIRVPGYRYNEFLYNVLCLLFVLLEISCIPTVSGVKCGYPGSPAYGRPSAVREDYDPGQSVGFTCALGFTLRGNLQRTCFANGTWSGHVPICDRSLSSMEQHASSRATLTQYAAEKAIDGNKDTCTYTDKRKPRWIRVDLQKDHTVQAVALTVPRNQYRTDNAHFTIYVISVKDATTASYHKCADFNGKFSASTVKLSCPGRGISGSYVHIEDNRSSVDYFSACEIEIFVRKATYECGEVERPTNSYTMSPDVGVVEYRCMYGYRLVGEPRRRCLPSGEWSGVQPLCEEVVCPDLDTIEHGSVHYSGPSRGRPVQGATANVTCDVGYQSKGSVLKCLDSGQWSDDGDLTCRPVDCLKPKVHHPLEKYRLLNGTTTYGSLALFYCGDHDENEVESPSDIRVCREDGKWSGFDSGCVAKNMISTLGLVEEQENVVPNGIIIGMAVVVLMLFVILILILLFKRKQLLRRQSTESLPSKETSSSLGHPPQSASLSSSEEEGTTDCKQSSRTYDNDVFYATIGMEDDKAISTSPTTSAETAAAPKQRSVERGILSSILFAKRKLGAQQRTHTSNENKSETSQQSRTPQDTSTSEPVEIHGNDQEGKSDNMIQQPVYAQIDFQEKRRSRLAKSLTEQLDCSGSGNDCCQENNCYDAELDSEPIKLRELPPIPPTAADDDLSSGTYASLSQPPEPPPHIMRDNNIYSTATGHDIPPPSSSSRYCHVNMKDNDLYSME